MSGFTTEEIIKIKTLVKEENYETLVNLIENHQDEVESNVENSNIYWNEHLKKFMLDITTISVMSSLVSLTTLSLFEVLKRKYN
jgi:hypothetical protein